MAEFNYMFTCDTGQAAKIELDKPLDRNGKPTTYKSVSWAADGAGGTATVVPSNNGMIAYLVATDALDVTGFTVIAEDADGSKHEAVTFGLTATEPDAAGAPAVSKPATLVERSAVPPAGTF